MTSCQIKPKKYLSNKNNFEKNIFSGPLQHVLIDKRVFFQPVDLKKINMQTVPFLQNFLKSNP